MDKHFSLSLTPKHGTQNAQDFDVEVSDPEGCRYTILTKWNVTGELDELIILNLKVVEFVSIDMNAIKSEYEMFDLKNRDFTKRRGEGMRAQHLMLVSLGDDVVQLFTAEILHIVSLQWSSVKISLGDQLMATSHLIGLPHLPLFQRMKQEHVDFLTLEPKYEKAMLIRNGAHGGDYAIVKGKWVKGKWVNGKWVNGMMRGNVGHLKVEIYSFQKRSTQTIHVGNSFILEIDNDFLQTKSDLKSGKIEIRFVNTNETNAPNLEVESMLAVILSVSALHVLLQPKEKPAQIILNSKSGGVQPPSGSIHSCVNDFDMFSMFGYYPLITSECFMHHYEHSKDFDRHHNDNDNDEGNDDGDHLQDHNCQDHHDHDHHHNGDDHHDCHDHHHHHHHHVHDDHLHQNNFDHTPDTNLDLNGWLGGNIEGFQSGNDHGGGFGSAGQGRC